MAGSDGNLHADRRAMGNRDCSAGRIGLVDLAADCTDYTDRIRVIRSPNLLLLCAEDFQVNGIGHCLVAGVVRMQVIADVESRLEGFRIR
jgi:hypothetical protein